MNKLTEESIKQQVNSCHATAEHLRRALHPHSAKEMDALCDTVETLLRALEEAVAKDVRLVRADDDPPEWEANETRERFNRLLLRASNRTLDALESTRLESAQRIEEAK